MTSDPSPSGAPDAASPRPSFREAVKVWARVAALSFGGPAGQIAVQQRILVEEKRWIPLDRFLHALNYCMLLPGPEATQLATYMGWLLHGTRGGLVAGTLFVLPGFLAILALSVLYVELADTSFVAALFYGLKPAVLAVVVAALWRLGRRALRGAVHRLVAAGAFVAMFVFDVPFPAIVVAAALVGLVAGRAHAGGAVDAAAVRPSWRRSLGVAALWLVVWWLPVALVVAVAGGDSVLVREGLFFSKVAVLSFGGAYAVLAYVAQRAVEDFGWLTAPEMLDGVGLAETTPGPLIMVVQFVGFLAAYRAPGALAPLAAGVAGSLVTTWVTFAPCFLWIFLGAPYIEWLRGRRRLAAAMSAITAAVVGVILDLAIWFAFHALFREVTGVTIGPVDVAVPLPSTLDPWALAIAVAAFIALLALRWGMLATLGAATAAGALVRWLGGGP